jgi:hypothetical protein
LLPAGAFAGWDLHPLESAAFPRRTPISDSDHVSALTLPIAFVIVHGSDDLMRRLL